MKFGGLIAIDDVSFSVEKNTITSLIGPNGAGKTTVFNCITGFYKPTIGEILLNSEKQFNLERMNDFTIPQKAKVARTFQNIRLFPQMTVLENLIVAQHNKLMKASMYTLKGLVNAKSFLNAENEAKELAKYWLDKIGASEVQNSLDDAPDTFRENKFGYNYHFLQCTMNVGNGVCLFWPSYMKHGYHNNQTPNRLSLSFNMMPESFNSLYNPYFAS